ncbi:MAG: hypothetical protein U0Q22_11640 [Acidimicrobiales bacterium]
MSESSPVASPPERHLTDLVERFSPRQTRFAVAGLAVAAAIVAWAFRFVQDDAFITFRYARNLARGEGLVLNPGQRVEGYTNFLWTWFMSIPEHMGWSAPTFSVIVGIALLVVTTFVAFRLATLVLPSEKLALLATAVLVANMSFVGYGTGGLETMLQTLLVTGVAVLLLEPADRSHRTLRRLAAGAIGAIACLTRLDSAVLVGTWFLFVVWQEWRGPAEGRVQRTAGAAALLGVPLVTILAPWLVWKYDYYGELLPNTLTAKSGGFVVPFLYGVFYLLAFFASYFGFLLIGRFRRGRKEFFANPLARAAFLPVAVWFLYTCVVGADFMEYRFMVPIIPVLALLAATLLNGFTDVRRQAALVVVLLAASAVHLVAPTVVPYPVLTFQELHHWPSESKTAWIALGRHLADEFPGGQKAPGQPVVALQPLGVISYYSDLPVVDMLGLADKEIARDGLQIPLYYPGHVRMATVPQLEAKKVNLVVGLPTYLTAKQLDDHRTSLRLSELGGIYSTADLKQLPRSASIVEVPIAPRQVWFMIYLRRNDKVEALIESGAWKRIGIDRTCRDSDLNILTRVLSKKTCDGA